MTAWRKNTDGKAFDVHVENQIMRNFADMLRNKKKTMDNTEEKQNTADQNQSKTASSDTHNGAESTDEQVIAEGAPYDEFENPELFDQNGQTAEGTSGDSPEQESDLTPEEKLAKQVEKLTQQLTGLNDKYLRMVAEFDNFRKRTSKERMELFKTAGKDVLVSIIPVMDDFERAEKALANSADVKALKDGFSIVSGKLKGILAQQGLKEMKSVGEAFNTDLHEAITNIPAPTPEMKGKVIDEAEKGYLLNDKVIRFAKVIIGE